MDDKILSHFQIKESVPRTPPPIYYSYLLFIYKLFFFVKGATESIINNGTEQASWSGIYVWSASIHPSNDAATRIPFILFIYTDGGEGSCWLCWIYYIIIEISCSTQY